MRTQTILTFTLIVFIGSLMLVLPSFEPSSEYTIPPNTEQIIVITIQSPIVKITALLPDTINLNVSIPDLDANSTSPYLSQMSINGQLEIEFDSPGIYVFTFLSTSLNQIDIAYEGVFATQLLTIFIIALVNIGIAGYVFYRRNVI